MKWTSPFAPALFTLTLIVLWAAPACAGATAEVIPFDDQHSGGSSPSAFGEYP